MKLRVLDPSIVCAAAILLIMGNCAYCAGWITGQGRFEKIAGSPSMGYKYLYEWDLFLSPADNSMVGPSRRLGAPPGQPPTNDGYYKIDNLPAGLYSIYVSQPDFFASPKVVPNVEIRNGQGTTVNIDLDVDYSTYFFPGVWTDWGPWTWYQTFLATGTCVRGISWIMAGTGSEGRVAIVEDNGLGDIRTWPEVGHKTKGGLGANSDQWVRWPSGQIKLVPGQTYAVKIWVDGGCAIYKRDKDGNSYPHGRAYDQDANPKNYDLNITVFVDKNNQSVTHTLIASKDWELHGELSDRRWGQTFVATGASLAAVDLFAASSDSNFDATWRIHQGGPSGPQIGPIKTTQRAYFTPGTHLIGVSYNPGDVLLVPGETYYIDVTDTQDFMPYVQRPWNDYPDGRAYRNGAATGYDLAMTIVEYTQSQQPKTVDLNGSMRVEFRDFSLLGLQWGRSGTGLSADFDNSLKVDAWDVWKLSSEWLRWTGGTR